MEAFETQNFKPVHLHMPTRLDDDLFFAICQVNIVSNRGWIDDAEVQRVRDAGYSDGEIAEIIANVALNIFTNYFNHIAQTEVDFPPVDVGQPKAA